MIKNYVTIFNGLALLCFSFPALSMDGENVEGLRRRYAACTQPSGKTTDISSGLISDINGEAEDPWTRTGVREQNFFSAIPHDIIKKHILENLTILDLLSMGTTSNSLRKIVEAYFIEKNFPYPRHILAPESDNTHVCTSGHRNPVPVMIGCGCCISSVMCCFYDSWTACGISTLACIVYKGYYEEHFEQSEKTLVAKRAENKVFTSIDDEDLFRNKKIPYYISGNIIKKIMQKYEQDKDNPEEYAYKGSIVLGDSDDDIYHIVPTNLDNYRTIHDRAVFRAMPSDGEKEGSISITEHVPLLGVENLSLKLNYSYEY